MESMPLGRGIFGNPLSGRGGVLSDISLGGAAAAMALTGDGKVDSARYDLSEKDRRCVGNREEGNDGGGPAVSALPRILEGDLSQSH